MRGLLAVLGMLVWVSVAGAQTCTHYASQSGGGNGLSQGSPFQIANFWAVTPIAGKTLCLLDGTYTGANSMIDPPDNIQGSSGSPITVRALNDGKVLINGQNARGPVKIQTGNHYFTVEGVNACCSNGSVFATTNATNVTYRRVIGWNAKDDNNMVFSVFSSAGPTLIEDAAGFGIARKIFEFSQGGNAVTCRRCWASWEGSHHQGPKMAYTMAYNSYNNTYENTIGQWSGERMQDTYTLSCPPGSDYPPCGTQFTGGAVDQPYGIYSIDREDASSDSNNMLLGSIAYILSGHDFRGVAPGRFHQAVGLDIRHMVSYITPGTNTTKPSYVFSNGTETAASTADHITGISNTSPATPGSLWTVTNQEQATSVSSIDSIFTGANGAAICYRYQDRTLTSTPLWPWPMNQRINDARASVGASAVDVTATIESIFGAIPPACRWDVVTLEPPLDFHKVSP